MVVFLSNGHGEDLIATMIAREVSIKRESFDIAGFPLVGLGKAYADADIKVIGVQKTMPSGGFLRHGLSIMLKDIKAGLIGLTLKQIKHLKSLKENVRLIVSVGDILPLFLGGRYVKAPMLFLSTAKSEYIRGHLGIECRLMRKYADLVLARDEKTKTALSELNVPAEYLGNVMMDGFSITGENFGLTLRKKVVGILPGSREEAYRNIGTILGVIQHLVRLSNNNLDFIVGLAPNLDEERLRSAVDKGGWHYKIQDPEHGRQGVTGCIYLDSGEETPCVIVSQGWFGDVLNISDIVIGLSGTGNEQAAGLGKPVITFPTEGPQFSLKFALAQKRLLGEAVSFVESGDAQDVASEVMRILGDSTLIAEMREAGYMRMGKQGAAARIAEIIINYLEAGNWEGS
ncbi:MAG: hypothetical protein GX969_00705 [Firmicutes bacterium]|nr:hypothetical protein [Bacillota bacterium]